MLYYWINLAFIYLRCRFFTNSVAIEETVSHQRRVGVFDCEGLRFMSNSKYPFYMDFIRYELLFRSPLQRATLKQGMLGMLGSQKIIYRRPLKLWQCFTLTLSLEGWEGNWAYHKHVFSRKGEIYAIGYTKLAFLKGKKPFDMEQIIRDGGYEGPKRIPDEEILLLFRGDSDLLRIPL